MSEGSTVRRSDGAVSAKAGDGPLAMQARTCVAAGLCALPAVRRGDRKRVALRSWKSYQSKLPSEQELRSWFHADSAAMCLVCGGVSGNLEVIDFDLGGEAFEGWRQAVEASLPGLLSRLVIESTPSGGRHVVYRCETPVSRSRKLAQRRIEVEGGEPVAIGGKEFVPRREGSGRWTIVATSIETRGEGGVFLCAPSPGYAVVQGDLAQPPILAPEERDTLLGCACGLDELPAPVFDGPARRSADPSGRLRPGDDFNLRGDVRAVLLRHGWALERPGANEHWRRPGKASGTSATLKDRVFFVFSSNAPPFEPLKSYSPFAVQALLDQRGDFAAAASELAAQGFGEPGRTRAVDGSTATASAQASMAPPRHAPLLVGELVDAHQQLRPPVIHGLLREGETMNIIASPKTGKSWLALDLAIAVASGCAWLGRYETAPGDVLVIDNELHRETTAYRIPQVAQARGVAMGAIRDRIAVDNLRGRLKDIFALSPYFESIEPGRYRVVVLDAFYRFMPAGGDENDNGAMANIYNHLDVLADRLRCCFVLIHHSSKGGQSGKSVTDVGAGAGAQSRATDTHLVLRPHVEDGVVVLDAAARSWAPIVPACLRWSFPIWTVDDRLHPAALKPDRPPRRKDAPPPAGPKGPEWTVERFVEHFASDEPLTIPRLRELARSADDLPMRRAEGLLSIAVSKGLVERRKLSGRGGPIGFVLPSGTSKGGDA